MSRRESPRGHRRKRRRHLNVPRLPPHRRHMRPRRRHHRHMRPRHHRHHHRVLRRSPRTRLPRRHAKLRRHIWRRHRDPSPHRDPNRHTRPRSRPRRRLRPRRMSHPRHGLKRHWQDLNPQQQGLSPRQQGLSRETCRRVRHMPAQVGRRHVRDRPDLHLTMLRPVPCLLRARVDKVADLPAGVPRLRVAPHRLRWLRRYRKYRGPPRH